MRRIVRTLSIASIVSMATLTGCLSTPPAVKPLFEAEEYHPPLPRPARLQTEQFVACPQDDTHICLTPDDAKKVVRNKAELLRWIKEANALLVFYRS